MGLLTLGFYSVNLRLARNLQYIQQYYNTSQSLQIFCGNYKLFTILPFSFSDHNTLFLGFFFCYHSYEVVQGRYYFTKGHVQKERGHDGRSSQLVFQIRTIFSNQNSVFQPSIYSTYKVVLRVSSYFINFPPEQTGIYIYTIPDFELNVINYSLLMAPLV